MGSEQEQTFHRKTQKDLKLGIFRELKKKKKRHLVNGVDGPLEGGLKADRPK